MQIKLRNQYHLADKLLGHFPIISLVGARQTGKTTLAKALRPDWQYFDLEKPDHFEIISRDPVLFFNQFKQNLIIDEAQLNPVIFDVLRGVIDSDRSITNRFILTGSSSADLLHSLSESLAGRVAILEIGTLKANEYYQKPLSSFYDLFKTKLSRDKLVAGTAPLTNQQMHPLWLKGGYPEPVLKNDDFFYQQWMENYYATYIHRDIAQLFPRLNKIKYQLLIKMLAKLSGTILNKSEVGRSLEISEATARDYLRIAEGTFIWRELFSWENNIVKSVVKMPKGHMRDSGLLHYLKNIRQLEELYVDPIVGHSFESFVSEEIIKGLQAAAITNWNYHYFRTRSGVEIDLILEGYFGLLPIEIKYGTTVTKRQLTNLTAFIEQHNLDFGLLINQSDHALWLNHKVYQVPIGWL